MSVIMLKGEEVCSTGGGYPIASYGFRGLIAVADGQGGGGGQDDHLSPTPLFYLLSHLLLPSGGGANDAGVGLVPVDALAKGRQVIVREPYYAICVAYPEACCWVVQLSRWPLLRVLLEEAHLGGCVAYVDGYFHVFCGC